MLPVVISSRPPARHGVARIHHQVQDGSLELRRIDAARPQISFKRQRKRVGITQRTAQERLASDDDFVERDDIELQLAAPREGQQLLRELRRAPVAVSVAFNRRMIFARGSSPPLSNAARIISMLPTMTASRLLKSCAMPPVSWPTTSSLCVCQSTSSVLQALGHFDFQSTIGLSQLACAFGDQQFEALVHAAQCLLGAAQPQQAARGRLQFLRFDWFQQEAVGATVQRTGTILWRW